MVQGLSCIKNVIAAAMIAMLFFGCKKDSDPVSARHEPHSQSSAPNIFEDVNDIFFGDKDPEGGIGNQLPGENKGDFLENFNGDQLHGMPVYKMDPALIPPREFKIEEPQKYL